MLPLEVDEYANGKKILELTRKLITEFTKTHYLDLSYFTVIQCPVT